MRWGDIGGHSRSQHVVVVETCDGYIEVLCGQRFIYGYHVERKKPLPRCYRCARRLRKEVERLTAMLATPTTGEGETE